MELKLCNGMDRYPRRQPNFEILEYETKINAEKIMNSKPTKALSVPGVELFYKRKSKQKVKTLNK